MHKTCLFVSQVDRTGEIAVDYVWMDHLAILVVIYQVNLYISC